jgi:predicted membrane protein
VAIGPIKLDLRGADLAAQEVTLSARTAIGAIKVWVPRGVRVEVEGTTAVGTRTIEESNLPPDVTVPTLRLRLDTGLGTVKVYRT